MDDFITSRAVNFDVAAAVWDSPRGAHVIAGSFGSAIDAPITTRASQISVSALPDAPTIANAVWEEAKAAHTTPGTFGNLLDTSISSRESESNADARETLNTTQHNTTQGLIGTPVTTVSADIAAVKAELGTVDTNVSAIKSKTDQLSFNAGNVYSIANVVGDKTGYSLSPAGITALVNATWEEPTASHNTAGTTGKALTDAGVATSPATIASAVWEEARAAHTTVGTFGETIDTKLSNLATLSLLTTVSNDVNTIDSRTSTIEAQTLPAALANAIWDASIAGHVIAGTFGKNLQGELTAARANLLDNLSRLDVVVSTRAQQVTVDDILEDTTQLTNDYTPARALKLDNLDAAISSRATPIIVPTLSQIVNGVWDEPLALHAVVGSTAKKLSDLVNAPTAGVVADTVWDTLKAAHNIAGSFGALLDTAISSRTTQTSLDAIKGILFNPATDDLHSIRTKLDTLPTTAGDATALNQANIIAALSTKASQSSISTLQSSVSSIPTNPLLDTDPRLANLDTPISTRASSLNIDSIKGAGFNPLTDTLEKISDAIALSVDLSPVLAGINDIKGVGFNSATDALHQLPPAINDAKDAAISADSSAQAAEIAALAAASQTSLNSLAAAVALIPTNPALTTDIRLARLDANISTRATQTSINDIQGVGFNTNTDSLAQISDDINNLNFGDATQTKQDQILAAIGTKAEDSSVNNLSLLVAGIPTNPLLDNDPVLNNLDALVSSRASQATLQSAMGGGFNPSTDSLEAISNAVNIAVDLTPVMNKLAEIGGTGFVSGVDDIVSLNNIAKTERGEILSGIESFLYKGCQN